MYDELHRLRCVSRSAITACTGSAPWEDRYLEVFSHDASGNRTGRRYGQYTTGDEDLYTYVTDSDIIDQVSSRGVTKQMSNTFRGELSQVTIYAPLPKPRKGDTRDPHVPREDDSEAVAAWRQRMATGKPRRSTNSAARPPRPSTPKRSTIVASIRSLCVA